MGRITKELLLLLFLLFASPAFAQCSITNMELVDKPERVIAGSAIIIQAYIEADSPCKIDELRFSSIGQASGEDLIIFDPPGGVFTNFLISDNVTKTFTVKTGTIDTFLYTIDLYEGGTNLSISDSVDFLDPSLITVTGPSNIVASDKFIFSIEISNPNAYSLITYYALSYDSIFSLTGGDLLADTIELAPGETKTFTWKMNMSEGHEPGPGNLMLQNGIDYGSLIVAAEFCESYETACENSCYSGIGVCCNNVWVPDTDTCPESDGGEGEGEGGGGGAGDGDEGVSTYEEEERFYEEIGDSDTEATLPEATTTTIGDGEAQSAQPIIDTSLLIIVAVVIIGVIIFIAIKGKKTKKSK